MPVIKEEKKEEKVEDDSTKLVSAYSKEGKKRNEKITSKEIFTPKFTLLYILVVALGLALALLIIYLIDKYE